MRLPLVADNRESPKEGQCGQSSTAGELIPYMVFKNRVPGKGGTGVGVVSRGEARILEILISIWVRWPLLEWVVESLEFLRFPAPNRLRLPPDPKTKARFSSFRRLTGPGAQAVPAKVGPSAKCSPNSSTPNTARPCGGWFRRRRFRADLGVGQSASKKSAKPLAPVCHAPRIHRLETHCQISAV